MAELPIFTQLESGIDVQIFRSRFGQYGWSYSETGQPLVNDLVLIKVGDGSFWHAGSISVSRELELTDLLLLIDYDNQLVGSEVGGVLVGDLMSRVRKTMPGYSSGVRGLMREQLEQQRVAGKAYELEHTRTDGSLQVFDMIRDL